MRPHLLARALPACHALVIAAIRLSVLASELENRAGTQQHHRLGTNEKLRPGGGLVRGVRQSSTFGFGKDGPYQWHFLRRVRRSYC